MSMTCGARRRFSPLQGRCLCERPVALQLRWGLQKTCWHLLRRCLCERLVTPDVIVPQECQIKERPTRVSNKGVLQ